MAKQIAALGKQITDLNATVLAKIPGGWQMVGMMLSLMVALLALLTAAAGLAQWLRWMPR